jgi:hypothetical protein
MELIFKDSGRGMNMPLPIFWKLAGLALADPRNFTTPLLQIHLPGTPFTLYSVDQTISENLYPILMRHIRAYKLAAT